MLPDLKPHYGQLPEVLEPVGKSRARVALFLGWWGGQQLAPEPDVKGPADAAGQFVARVLGDIEIELFPAALTLAPDSQILLTVAGGACYFFENPHTGEPIGAQTSRLPAMLEFQVGPVATPTLDRGVIVSTAVVIRSASPCRRRGRRRGGRRGSSP